MKLIGFLRLFSITFFLLLCFWAKAQENTSSYFQQEVNTIIDATLNDVDHVLTGSVKIEYINKSPDALDTIYMHLWANAYKDRTTAFAKQQIRNQNTKFHYAEEQDRGNFRNINFTIDGEKHPFAYFNEQWDIAIIPLKKTLKAGDKIIIEVPLDLKIPASFSRLGHVGTSYQMTQWFPKPAVYDRDGWHPMPYLTQGEFYSEFGSYNVTLTLPENYVVAATGTLDTDSEYQFLERKIQETKAFWQDSLPPVDISFPESSSKMKTITFKAANVHDFGWFADKRFYVERGSVSLSDGKIVDTYVYYTDTERDLWKDALSYVNRSTKFYSDMVGNYPYPHATAVQSALSAGGGMEYPMITVIGTMGNAQALDGVITHEVGHNWFYGILGFNERDHAWLDEGINSYYDHRYSQEFYTTKSSMGLPKWITSGTQLTESQFLLNAQVKRGHDQPPSLHSEDFESTNYFFSCYEKPAVAFEFLEQYLGAEKFDKIMQSLYREWEFKHPGPQDVIEHFTKESGEDLSWFFDGFIYSADEANYKVSSVRKDGENYKLKIKNVGQIDAPFPVSAFKDGKSVVTQWYPATSNSSIVDFPYGEYDYILIDSSYTMLDVNITNNYKKTKGVNLPRIGLLSGMDDDKKKQLFVIPTPLFNRYDGFMLGLTLHNVSVPMPKFKAAITTVYGFRSNLVAGTARLQYDQPVKKGILQRISYKLVSNQYSLDYSTASGDQGKYGTIVPSIKFHFMHAPGSIWTSTAELKNTFVRIYDVTGIASEEGIDDDYLFTKLEYEISKRHPLTPLKVKTSVEYMDYQSVFSTTEANNQQTVKLDLEALQEFAYMKGKKLQLRAYVGYFPVRPDVSTTGLNQTRAGNNANINLVHNSFADHAFEDYFMGRNTQTGYYSRQFRMRGGAFKLGNIDGGTLGQSDELAYALNFVTDIPIKKVPNVFKLYFDYGAYKINRQSSSPREWEEIYSGGIMINALDAIAIYFPLVNSANINGLKEGNYFNQIGFMINLDKLDIIDLYNNFRI